MRAKLLTALVAAGVLAAAGGAGAAGGTRRAMLPYAPTDDNFTVGAPNDVPVIGTGATEAQYDFPIQKGEKFADVMILDDSEGPVSAIVSQWVPTDRQEAGPASATTYKAVTYVRFCTQTESPVPLKPKLEVRIIIAEGTCQDGTPSVPTSGDIVVDFSRGG